MSIFQEMSPVHSVADFIKDIAILMAMVTLLGSSSYVFKHFDNILSQIVVLFAATIILPMFTNMMFFLKHPARSLGLTKLRYSTCQNIVLYILVILLSPILPALILYRKRRCRASIEKHET